MAEERKTINITKTAYDLLVKYMAKGFRNRSVEEMIKGKHLISFDKAIKELLKR